MHCSVDRKPHLWRVNCHSTSFSFLVSHQLCIGSASMNLAIFRAGSSNLEQHALVPAQHRPCVRILYRKQAWRLPRLKAVVKVISHRHERDEWLNILIDLQVNDTVFPVWPIHSLRDRRCQCPRMAPLCVSDRGVPTTF